MADLQSTDLISGLAGLVVLMLAWFVNRLVVRVDKMEDVKANKAEVRESIESIRRDTTATRARFEADTKHLIDAVEQAVIKADKRGEKILEILDRKLTETNARIDGFFSSQQTPK